MAVLNHGNRPAEREGHVLLHASIGTFVHLELVEFLDNALDLVLAGLLTDALERRL